MKKTVSAIIPIFDEEKNISFLLKFLLKTPFFDEIICVNDGSTDKSLSILQKFENKIKIVDFKKNYGKGHALSEGVKKAIGEIVVFLDADLVNLTEKHLESLLDPILKAKKRVVLGYGTPKKDHFFASRSWVKKITGQRVYYKNDLLPYLNEMAKKRYGVDIYLSSLFNKNQTEMIPLIKLTHVWNHKKNKPLKALKRYLRMNSDVAQEIGKNEIEKSFALAKSAQKASFKTIKKEMGINGKSYRLITKAEPYYQKAIHEKQYLLTVLALTFSIVLIAFFLFIKVLEPSNPISKTAEYELERILAIKIDFSSLSQKINFSADNLRTIFDSSQE